MKNLRNILRIATVVLLLYNLQISGCLVSLTHITSSISLKTLSSSKIIPIVKEFLTMNLISIAINSAVSLLMIMYIVVMYINNKRILNYTREIGNCLTSICDVSMVEMISLSPFLEFNTIITAIVLLVVDRINSTIEYIESTIEPKINLIAQYKNIKHLKQCKYIIKEYVICTFHESIIGSLGVAESIIIYSTMLKTTITENIKNSISTNSKITDNIIAIIILQIITSILYTKAINYVSKKYLNILKDT